MHFLWALLLIGLSLSFPSQAIAQKKTPVVARPPLLLRTTNRREVRRFHYGGTVTLIGAPQGSVTIEGWSRNEVDISAEVQLRADTEADLDLLARVNTVALDEDTNHIRVLTTGTHDRVFMRAVAKKFPKTLLGLPWRIDYRIRVPALTDLDINAGRGAITVSGVEGNIRISGTENEANLTVSGGTLSAIIAAGKLNLQIPAKSWRGVGAELRLVAGQVTLELPVGFSGDIDAEVLRTGQIVDAFGGLEPRERAPVTPQKIRVRAGAGGAAFQIAVGDGTILIKKQEVAGKQ